MPSSFARGPYTEALKKRLADAFQRGVLVALEAPSTPSTAVDGSRVTLTLEWASDVVEQLSQDVWILVSKGNTVIQRFPLSTAHREDGLARLSAGEWGSQETLTVVAQRGDTTLVLLRHQRAGDLAGTLVWEHSLEELLTARDEPSPPIHSSIRRAPEDTRAERDSGDIQEI
ncbi:hypothetical protein [Stigmatella erecta]|uniref:hypothetical protein n=1 Tax=Stigmatella erecta TaxID=83460 RepID=UPI001160D2FF|nr:hypothetical protein [Stigmatella erecta]